MSSQDQEMQASPQDFEALSKRLCGTTVTSVSPGYGSMIAFDCGPPHHAIIWYCDWVLVLNDRVVLDSETYSYDQVTVLEGLVGNSIEAMEWFDEGESFSIDFSGSYELVMDYQPYYGEDAELWMITERDTYWTFYRGERLTRFESNNTLASFIIAAAIVGIDELVLEGLLNTAQAEEFFFNPRTFDRVRGLAGETKIQSLFCEGLTIDDHYEMLGPRSSRASIEGNHAGAIEVLYELAPWLPESVPFELPELILDKKPDLFPSIPGVWGPVSPNLIGIAALLGIIKFATLQDDHRALVTRVFTSALGSVLRRIGCGDSVFAQVFKTQSAFAGAQKDSILDAETELKVIVSDAVSKLT